MKTRAQQLGVSARVMNFPRCWWYYFRTLACAASDYTRGGASTVRVPAIRRNGKPARAGRPGDRLRASPRINAVTAPRSLGGNGWTDHPDKSWWRKRYQIPSVPMRAAYDAADRRDADLMYRLGQCVELNRAEFGEHRAALLVIYGHIEMGLDPGRAFNSLADQT